LQVFSVSSSRLNFFAFFSISLTRAKASGLISFADGCGGRGWPAGIICRRSEVTLSDFGSIASILRVFCLTLELLLGADFAFESDLLEVLVVALLDKPKRWTFPMTAFRVTPPSSLAI
jgi:hypothetical protein